MSVPAIVSVESSRLRPCRKIAIACRADTARFGACGIWGKACALAEADRLLLQTLARRCGVYLALAALALQLALSFGHVHRHDIVYPNVAYSKVDFVAGWHLPAKPEVSKQLPSGLADEDEPCAICLSILLMSTSFIPDAPQYSPSSEFNDVDRFVGHIFDIVFEPRRAPFQSRAPPLG